MREDIGTIGGAAADGALQIVEVADDSGDVGHLHLGRNESGGFDAGVGWNIAGGEPVEDGGGSEGHLAESPDGIFGAAHVVGAGARLGGKGAGPFCVAEKSFANLAVLRIGEVVGGVAGFGIEEDGGDDGLHVATNAGAIVFEDRSYAANIGRAGIAGD